MMSTFPLGRVRVRRSGYGAMQLAGPFSFSTPPDRPSAIGVLRAVFTLREGGDLWCPSVYWCSSSDVRQLWRKGAVLGSASGAGAAGNLAAGKPLCVGLAVIGA